LNAYNIGSSITQSQVWVEQKWTGAVKIEDSSPFGALVDALVITFAATIKISILVKENQSIN
jgi:hypothetical protein